MEHIILYLKSASPRLVITPDNTQQSKTVHADTPLRDDADLPQNLTRSQRTNAGAPTAVCSAITQNQRCDPKRGKPCMTLCANAVFVNCARAGAVRAMRGRACSKLLLICWQFLFALSLAIGLAVGGLALGPRADDALCELRRHEARAVAVLLEIGLREGELKTMVTHLRPCYY